MKIAPLPAGDEDGRSIGELELLLQSGYRYALSLTHDRAAAEDLLQDAAAALVRYGGAKGGSWFCSRNYCHGYRPGFRGKSPEGRAFNNVGFRCARGAPMAPS